MFKDLKSFFAPRKGTILKTLHGSYIIHAPLKEIKPFLFQMSCHHFIKYSQLTIGDVLYFCRLIKCEVRTWHCSSNMSFSTCKNCVIINMSYTTQQKKRVFIQMLLQNGISLSLSSSLMLFKQVLSIHQSPKSSFSAH